ncbi:MAG: flagellum-specific ATP synthase FliI, partial [Bryobacteraceae bacterium]
LSRELGAAGHYPAIDILHSVSRLASRIAGPQQKEASQKIREALSMYQRSEDLINLGAYASGSNPKLDSAIKVRPQLMEFLRQDANVTVPVKETLAQLIGIAGLV